ncbi:MAG: hypothetical protein QOF33_4308 [Thermomicrobiales bacterium]|jgi:hypothetical protein|nr:hypothetical protein [Thermomicrobiales bacterium]
MSAWVYRDGARLELSRPGLVHGPCLPRVPQPAVPARVSRTASFASLGEARQTIEAWRVEDDTERPQRARGQQAPAAWITSRAERPG